MRIGNRHVNIPGRCILSWITCISRVNSNDLYFLPGFMNRYVITISAVAEAEDEEEAKEVAQEIVNAEFPDEIEKRIESLHFHDGYGNAEITALE